MPTKMELCTSGACNRFNVNDGKLNNIRSAIDIGDGKFRYQDDFTEIFPLEDPALKHLLSAVVIPFSPQQMHLEESYSSVVLPPSRISFGEQW